MENDASSTIRHIACIMQSVAPILFSGDFSPTHVVLPSSLRKHERITTDWNHSTFFFGQALSTLRTVFRDTFRKCSRLTRAIVSTISIPNHLLHSKAGSATDQPVGGQFWTPIPRLRGSILQAE